MPPIQRGQAYRLGPNRWGLRYYDIDGHRRRKSPFPSKSAALQHYRDQVEPMLLGEPAARPEVTLAEFVPVYLERHGANVRPRTIVTLRERLAHATRAWGDVPLRDLERMSGDIATWQARLPERSRYGVVQALRQTLAAAVRWGYMNSNPATIAGRNRQPAPRTVRTYSREELVVGSEPLVSGDRDEFSVVFRGELLEQDDRQRRGVLLGVSEQQVAYCCLIPIGDAGRNAIGVRVALIGRGGRWCHWGPFRWMTVPLMVETQRVGRSVGDAADRSNASRRSREGAAARHHPTSGTTRRGPIRRTPESIRRARHRARQPQPNRATGQARECIERQLSVGTYKLGDARSTLLVDGTALRASPGPRRRRRSSARGSPLPAGLKRCGARRASRGFLVAHDRQPRYGAGQKRPVRRDQQSTFPIWVDCSSQARIASISFCDRPNRKGADG